MYVVGRGMTRSRSPIPQLHENGKAFLWFNCGHWLCVQKMFTFDFFPLDIYSLKTAPTETAPPEISQTFLLDPALYHKPCLLVYLYEVTLPPYSTVQDQHSGLRGFCGFSIREPNPPNPSFSVCFSVCFIHPLLPEPGQSLKPFSKIAQTQGELFFHLSQGQSPPSPAPSSLFPGPVFPACRTEAGVNVSGPSYAACKECHTALILR